MQSPDTCLGVDAVDINYLVQSVHTLKQHAFNVRCTVISHQLWVGPVATRSHGLNACADVVVVVPSHFEPF